MESTSLDDLVSLAEALLVDRQRRRKLGVFVYGNKHALPDTAASNTPEVKGSSLFILASSASPSYLSLVASASRDG